MTLPVTSRGTRLATLVGAALLSGCADVAPTAIPSRLSVGSSPSAVLLNDNSCGVPPSPTAGLSQLVAQPTSLEGTITSLTFDRPTLLRFTNALCATVRVYWLDYSGQRVLYNTLAAHTDYVQPTYVTHPWVITDASDRALMIFLPSAASSEAYISSSDIFLPLPPAPPVLPRNGPGSFAGAKEIDLCIGGHGPVGYVPVGLKDDPSCHVFGQPDSDVRVTWYRYGDDPIGSSLWMCSSDVPVGWVYVVGSSDNPDHMWQCRNPWHDFLVDPPAIEIERVF